MSDPDLAGKVAVVTGSNAGIGKETAVALAGMGATVVVAARNAEKAATAVDEIRARTNAGDRVQTLRIDLASFASVRAFADAFAKAYDRCDVLVNNAGLMLRKRTVTGDGHETQFQVNHLGHFLLTNLLRERLVGSAPARVVNVASDAHKMARRGLRFDDLDWQQRRYRGFAAYSATKLMNLLFTRELAHRWADDGVTVNAAHPGWVGTNFAMDGDYARIADVLLPLTRKLSRTPAEGAATSIYLASSPAVDGVSGQYFADSRAHAMAKSALDDAAAKHLWDVSAELTGLS